jgi:spermidine synthase
VIVAVFMLGLGAGSYVAGRWADRGYVARRSNPLRTYGYFELAIAALGAAIALVLPHLDRLSVLVTSYRVDPNGWYVLSSGSYAARVAIALTLLTPITLLMGGTLTLLIRYLVRAEVEREASRIAVLYAVNTAGAAAGCFLTDFALVPAWGLLNTQLLAVALNAMAGVGAILLVRLKPGPTAIRTPAPGGSRARTRKSSPASIRQGAVNGVRLQPDQPSTIGGVRLQADLPLIATALALSGFAGLGMEILWFRHFSIMLGAFRAVFSLLLTVILVGIGAGSLGAGVLQRRVRSPEIALIGIQSLLIAFTLAGVWSADSSVIDRTVSDAMRAFGAATAIDQLASPGTLNELWFNLRPMLLEVAVPALLIGFSFPLGNAVVQHAEQSVGRRAGVLYLANTAGAVAGSLVTGFVLLPSLGLQTSTSVLMLAAAAGLVPLYRVVRLKADPTGDSRRISATTRIRQELSVASGFRRTFWIAPAIAITWLVGWFLLPSDFIRTRALPKPEPNERVLTQSEGVNEIVTITETSGKGRRLMTNGHAMSATWPLSQRYMRALAHVPLLMMENPSRVLVIGFGVGNTAAAAALHPSVTHVEVADLSRNVLDHATYFSSANGDVLKHPSVTVFVNDGRHHLLMQPSASYDLITLEPPPIGYAGVASLYSEEFYRLARSRLTPNGFVSQWLPAYQVSTATTLSMIKSFVDVFPESVLLSGAEADLILLGANNRIQIDPNQLFAAMSQRPAARADLARLDLGTPREIVGMFVGSSTTLVAATREAIPVTDDRPVQEFGVHSLLDLGESVPGSVVNLGAVGEWCPACFDNGAPVRPVEGLDLYLALLSRAYAASPEEGARIRAAADNGRRVAGSSYLGAVVPETSEVHNDLGIAYASRGQLDAAIAEFRRALDLAPDSAATHWHLGAALAERGALEEAEVHLRASVQSDPTNVDAIHDLESVVRLRGK